MDLIAFDVRDVRPKSSECTYYEMLGVSPDSTDEEIRKAYRIKARIYHPDRNLNDPEADKMFQDLFEAYSVLSDPRKRTIYDKKMKWEGDNVDFVSFYRSIFGGEAFVDVVGDMSIGVMMEFMESEEYKGLPESEKGRALMEHVNAQQKIRIEKLVYRLQVKLEPYISGETSGVVLINDTKEKGDVPGGAHLLALIASVYKSEAAKKGKLIESITSYISEKKRYFFQVYDLVKLMVKIDNINKLENESENPTHNEEMDSLRLYTIWKMGKLEIESVNRKACKIFLNDKSVDSKILKKRRNGILKIAQLYQQRAESYLAKVSEKEMLFVALNKLH